jgi:hypothetical protein
VLGNLSRDPLHVGGFPCEHVEVHFEEVDERAFLFRIERRPDTELTAIVEDDRILDILGGLERAGRMLRRLGDVLVLGTRLSMEPRGPDSCFSELKALSIALVCTLVRRPCWKYALDSTGFDPLVGSDGFDPLWCKSPNGPQML